MLSDEVKAMYRRYQGCLVWSSLDARISVMRAASFYDKVTEVFNNQEYIPETKMLPDLHEHFAEFF